MPPSYFPLRWESTGDQWWYASPIDWAAANGLYDLVVELLHLDPNLLIKVTSLRRIRRLETVWDDEAQFDDVAQCRSLVSKRLLNECESTNGTNTLIRAGYGGWLLYTAASAGDMDFVKQLLERDPFLVFGEGEYGVTDVFYAAARSKNAELFTMLLDFAVSSRDEEDESSETRSVFKWEMMNRAAHAAARGGGTEILRRILGDSDDVLAYRDVQGSTLLHTASGRGQIEVVKYLVTSFEIIASTDGQGNTALHTAAYRGYLNVVEFLLRASPNLASVKNDCGSTFLHVAVAGFRTPGFRRIDQQIELMKRLVCSEVFEIRDIINVRNSDGRTALHMAVIDNVQSRLVELLMSVPCIDLNVRDADGSTTLDLLKRRPKSTCSEILIKDLIAAGGISNCQDNAARSAIVSCLKENGVGASPGTSFRVPDAEIFLYTGSENAYDAGCDQESVGYSSCLSDLSELKLSNTIENKKPSSINHTARRLKNLLHWPRKERKTASAESVGDDDPLEVMSTSRNWSDSHIPLREKYTKSSLPNNTRTFSLGRDLPSPSSRKKFTAGLTHGVIQATPHLAAPLKSPPSPISASSTASPVSVDEQKVVRDARLKQLFDGKATRMSPKENSVDKRLMNQYFCFGAQGLAPSKIAEATHGWIAASRPPLL
ncbi:Lysine histidine transporter 1 [Hibiscus syriacus]|uniref:Lysine histidine transporter 1 n=1 Tax=Hibiscus syriacus TaxID=106335 RepID=A0A6A2ZYM0_HIBSY|nr:putative ankyrin repeat protein RF_0381 [Hibiscus syriacus]KAE8696636.1 Lysine histidine transporter 1 [Hibiscus syriacus]